MRARAAPTITMSTMMISCVLNNWDSKMEWAHARFRYQTIHHAAKTRCWTSLVNTIGYNTPSNHVDTPLLYQH
jgi:hypothetical protein